MILGDARVSTDGQSLDAQVKQLRAAGAVKVFKETGSGTKTDRVQLRRALDQPCQGRRAYGDALAPLSSALSAIPSSNAN